MILHNHLVRMFVSAGEASGDAYAAALVRAVRSRLPDVRPEGMGGNELRSTGAQIVADASRNSAIGILSSVMIAPRVLFDYLRVKKALKSGKPGVFVPIDYGFVNIRLARYAKGLGWKVLYFIPPGSWRKDRQGKDMPAITDAIVTPFSWSAEMLNQMGADAHWFGHPIKSLCQISAEDDRHSIAILPGSRAQEIKHNLPAIAEAIRGYPPVEFAVASSIGRARLRELWSQCAPERTQDVFTEADVVGVLRRARLSIVCSGTATLQAAVLKCPMVVIYGFSLLMEAEARLLGLHKKVQFVALPNIFLGREAVPELLGRYATGVNIRTWIERLDGETDERANQLRAFEELADLLGPEDCIEQTADLIVKLGRDV